MIEGNNGNVRASKPANRFLEKVNTEGSENGQIG